MALRVNFYNEKIDHDWDEFVLNKSLNGTFLQTRRFIEYHPQGRYDDCSLCIRKGNELVSVILANIICEYGGKTFFAHKGTTFGGICISSHIYSSTGIDELISQVLAFLKEHSFDRIYLKMVPNIYQKTNTDMLDYFLYKYGFECYNELNYYLVLDKYKDDISAPFTSSKRRDYKYSLKNNFLFKELTSKEEIARYYEVLIMNLNKLGLSPVHSLEDLIDLKFNRFFKEIAFYGVYIDKQIVAGSMLFYFGEDIVHTQYLSSDERYLKMYSMDFLIYNLISVAVRQKMRLFTFGICTENQGKDLNFGLSRFKEGFGTEYCINRSYERVL